MGRQVKTQDGVEEAREGFGKAGKRLRRMELRRLEKGWVVRVLRGR